MPNNKEISTAFWINLAFIKIPVPDETNNVRVNIVFHQIVIVQTLRELFLSILYY